MRGQTDMDEGDTMDDFRLSHRQKDALQETGNIAAGYAATALSSLLGETIMIDVTECRIAHTEEIPASFGDVTSMTVATYMGIQAAKHGAMLILFPPRSAMALCDMFNKEEPGTTTEITDSEIGILAEVGNICICAYLNALSKLLDLPFMPTPPSVAVDMVGAILENIAAEADALGDFSLLIETDFVHRYGRSQGHFIFMPDQKSKDDIFRRFNVEAA